MSTKYVSHLKPIGIIQKTVIWYIAKYHKLLNYIYQNTPCDRINAFVMKEAKRGDVQGILGAVDKYCLEVEYVMNLSRHKADRFLEIVNECKPKVCLELGTFCGYSAILLASVLPPGSKIYTVEFIESHANAARELIAYAGMADKVTVIHGDAGEVVPSLREKYSLDKFDMIFMDHHKPYYVRELKLLEAGRYLRKGTVVIGDDLGWPGAPAYDEYIQTSPNYQNTYYDTKIDMLGILDVMGKSVYKGD